MTPSELADEVTAQVNRVAGLCAERVGPDSIGAKQYYKEGEPQLFERMDFDALCEYYEEELRDIINYAVMTHIRLGRMRGEIARRMREEG
jgi:hypothetical protein